VVSVPVSALTDAFVRSISAPESGRLEISDSRCTGLAIRVTPNGVKSWSFRYRDPISGRTERYAIGRYPDTSLATARTLADEKRVGVSRGSNPRAELRKARAAERAAITFDDLAEKFLREYAQPRRPRSAEGTRSALKPARLEFGSRKAGDLDRTEIVAFLRARATKAPIAANRTLSALSKMFNWALDEGHVQATPIVRIPKPSPENARERVLTEGELALMWKAFETLEPAMEVAFKFLAASGQRLGEVVRMTTDELYDLEKPSEARLELPPERVKNGRRHVVPLPPLLRSLLQEAIGLKPAHEKTNLVFVSPRNPGEPFDQRSMARAMKRLITEMKATDQNKDDVLRLQAEPATPHDLRRTAVTGMSRIGVPAEHIKAVVNHLETGITARVYDRWGRFPEKRRALELWEHEVLHAVGVRTRRPGTVVKLRARVP
jgi:integrase